MSLATGWRDRRARRRVDRYVSQERSKGLRRFREAQDAHDWFVPAGARGQAPVTCWERAVWELEQGVIPNARFWLPVIFPMEYGWAETVAARIYSVTLQEAAEYLNDAELNHRYHYAAGVIKGQIHAGRPLLEIFGEIEALRLAASIDLFARLSTTLIPLQKLIRSPRKERSTHGNR